MTHAAYDRCGEDGRDRYQHERTHAGVGPGAHGYTPIRGQFATAMLAAYAAAASISKSTMAPSARTIRALLSPLGMEISSLYVGRESNEVFRRVYAGE
jgi:hypothetical protein